MYPSDVFYVARDGKQKGPISSGQLEQGVRDGKLRPTDLCWYDGLSDWQPLGEVVPDLFGSGVATRSPPPLPKPDPVTADVVQRKEPIEYAPWFFWVCVVGLAVLATITGHVANAIYESDPELGGVVSLYSVPLFALSLGVWTWLHYRLWDALPEEFRATTPGKAVGFLFIPFFNFYWVFVSNCKLSEGLHQWSVQNPKTSAIQTGGLAMVNAVLFVLSLTVGLIIPELAIATERVALFAGFIYYYQLIQGFKALTSA